VAAPVKVPRRPGRPAKPICKVRPPERIRQQARGAYEFLRQVKGFSVRRLNLNGIVNDATAENALAGLQPDAE